MSYDTTNARHIALRLSTGQAFLVLDLDGDPTVLGCVEATAIRMTKATKRRPALVERALTRDGQTGFILTKIGFSVKTELQAVMAEQ
ncbi:hypothetical protein QE363_000771 [Sphingomonas sp. SORGH_AS870]|uniref:hypothetical protein n=1 Tax=Sphingomonas sp. SORGH_AS_0870 TaxID=3041801 RepID=UPI00286501DF|nr:hypothetical protein [Sphingomonas sp. SORGH_AS_0870]MDR6144978.1 hypothetical protein [Sphingomonas sp. SORGH_AS_0870]